MGNSLSNISRPVNLREIHSKTEENLQEISFIYEDKPPLFMSEITDKESENFLKTLDRIKSIIPIDRTYFAMLFQSFKDLESSAVTQDWLVNHKEISIDAIKNTKIIFHQVLFGYVMSLALEQKPMRLNDLEKEELQVQVKEAIESLVAIAKEEEQVLKLPTIEKLREIREKENENSPAGTS